MMRLVALHLRGTYLRRKENNGLVKGIFSSFVLHVSTRIGLVLVLGSRKEGFRGSRCGIFRGVAYRSTSSPRSFSILTVFGGW